MKRLRTWIGRHGRRPVPCCPHCPGEQQASMQPLTVRFDGGNEQEFVAWLRKQIRKNGGSAGVRI